MARSSAAQEPSMEEILASIRKIIESGDERPDGVEVGEAGPVAVSDAPHNRPAETGTQSEPEDDARSRTPGAEAERPVVDVSETFSDAADAAKGADAFLDADFTDLKLELEQEFSSSIGEAATLAAPVLRPASIAAQFQPTQLPEQIERVAVEWPLRSDGRHAALRAAAAVAGDREAARPAVSGEAPVDPQPSASGPPHRPANSDDPRMREFREAILRDSERTAPPPLAEPLISSRSGNLVSASFEELDRAIREGQLRSMEEMAEEMMRPMLQEWLDDNLPRIVERLVREEIERVARGGR